MTGGEDVDLDELRAEASPGERAEGKGQLPDLVDALADERIAVEEGTVSGQVAIRDDLLIALANTLDEREGDYGDLVAQVEDEVSSTPNLEEGTKAYLIALLARAGLESCAEDYHEMLGDAVGEAARRTM